MPAVSLFEIEKYITGIEYPAPKEGLVEVARENGASDDVIGVLQRLPADMIDSPEDLISLFGDITGEEDEANLAAESAWGEIGEGEEEHYFHKEG